MTFDLDMIYCSQLKGAGGEKIMRNNAKQRLLMPNKEMQKELEKKVQEELKKELLKELQKECVTFLVRRGVRLNFKNYYNYITPDDPWGHVQLIKFYTDSINKYKLSLEEVMEQMLLAFTSLTEGETE